MKVFLYMHGGSGNHGCEALVRTIANLCSSVGKVSLFSRRPEEDQKYIGNNLNVVQCGAPLSRYTMRGIISRIRCKLLHNNFAYVKPSFSPLLKSADKNTIALSIGGDNYCYDGVPKVLAILNRELQKKGTKTVLFGCSIEPSLLENFKVIEDLNRYSLIVPRESITEKALLDAGVTTKIVKLPDPAFTLPKKIEMNPDRFFEGNTVGINISPMVLEYEEGKQVLFQAYVKLIEYIINDTDMNVALIPHVVWKSTNDLEPISKLFEIFSSTKRIKIVQDNNAEVLKGYISRCRFFVGARTHSTIAAYSSCVPTLTVGYSVKSCGIARDLFGTEENYVCKVNDIQSSTDLVDAFIWIIKNEKSIKNTLDEIIPKYIQKAYEATELIKRIANDH